MKNKVYILLVTLIISILLPSQIAVAKTFSDVTQYKSEIEFLTGREIIRGYDTSSVPIHQSNVFKRYK